MQVISTTSGRVIVDNIGNYNPATGVVNLSGFKPSGANAIEIKISAVPSNQGFVSTIRENKLGKDLTAITVDAIETTTL